MNTSEFYKWWDSNSDVRYLKERSEDAVERIAAEAFLAGMRAAAELHDRETESQEQEGRGMKLHENTHYRDPNGEIVTVVRDSSDESDDLPWLGSDGMYYTDDGKALGINDRVISTLTQISEES